MLRWNIRLNPWGEHESTSILSRNQNSEDALMENSYDVFKTWGVERRWWIWFQNAQTHWWRPEEERVYFSAHAICLPSFRFSFCIIDFHLFLVVNAVFGRMRLWIRFGPKAQTVLYYTPPLATAPQTLGLHSWPYPNLFLFSPFFLDLFWVESLEFVEFLG